MHQLKYNKTEHKTPFILGANSYMFRHQGAIFRELITTNNRKFKAYKSVHHHTIQINQPTRCNNFSSLLSVVYVQLNMFRASSRPSSSAQQLQ